MKRFTQTIQSWTRKIDGVAATEFALVVPILSVLLLGIADFGMYINQQMKLENAARASAEYIMRGGSADNLSADVISQIVENDEGVTITTTASCECGDGEGVLCDAVGVCADGYIRRFQQVDLAQSYDAIFAFPGISEDLELTGSARVQVE